MRCIWLVTFLLISAVGCAQSDECVSSVGVERSVPEMVRTELEKKGLSSYLLLDRVDCGEIVYWTAVPSSTPVNVPRPPGFGYSVVFNSKSRMVRIDRGQ